MLVLQIYSLIFIVEKYIQTYENRILFWVF